jgi:hypothetical protein
MKYSLAIIKNILEIYGFDPCIGYDIMCAFIKTLHKSSLAQMIKKHRFVGWYLLFTDMPTIENARFIAILCIQKESGLKTCQNARGHFVHPMTSPL